MARDTRDYPGAGRFVPGDDASLRDLAEAARSWQGCDLYERDVTVVPTIHPSAVLPADDRDAAYAGLVSDLRVAASCRPG
jgi:hypothetical protein